MKSVRGGLLALRLMVLVPVAALTAVALAACSMGGSAGDSVSREPAASSGSGAAGATTAAAALAKVGLALPDGAGGARVEVQQLQDRKEAYLVTFTAGREAALGFCDGAGLGGARSITALPSTARAGLGDLPVTEDSRWCDGVWPEDTSWFRYVLVDAGEPATVHVSLQHLSR